MEQRPSLAVVRAQAEPVAARVRRLQEEARGHAREHVTALVTALLQVEQLSVEIASGGDAYPAGIRDIARILAEDMARRSLTIAAIHGRSQ